MSGKEGDGSEQPPENGVPLEQFMQGKDVYIIYSWEDVAFLWKHDTERVFRRFRGMTHESETVHSNRLFTDAQMYGRQASKREFEAFAPLSLSGKIASMCMRSRPAPEGLR